MAIKKTAKKADENSANKEEKNETAEVSKSPDISAPLPVHSRIQTAEGWRRSQHKRRQEKQQKAKG